MNVLIFIENNLASSISLRYICKQSQKVSMFIQPIHVEEPTQGHFQFGAGWVRKTWERTLVDTTKDEIETFLKAEAGNCRGLTKVKILVGDKEKELQKEMEGGFYDLFVMGHLSSFDSSMFYELIKGSFLKKLSTPVLLVKNLTPFEKVHILLDEYMDIEKLIHFYLKLYENAQVNVSLVSYKFSENKEIAINDGSENKKIQLAKELLMDRGISPSEILEIEGSPEVVGDRLKSSGMVVSMLNKKGRKRPTSDVLASTPVPVLIIWD